MLFLNSLMINFSIDIMTKKLELFSQCPNTFNKFPNEVNVRTHTHLNDPIYIQ
jgi:hypothetical protein